MIILGTWKATNLECF
jgi:hypothetical protein